MISWVEAIFYCLFHRQTRTLVTNKFTAAILSFTDRRCILFASYNQRYLLKDHLTFRTQPWHICCEPDDFVFYIHALSMGNTPDSSRCSVLLATPHLWSSALSSPWRHSYRPNGQEMVLTGTRLS